MASAAVIGAVQIASVGEFFGKSHGFVMGLLYQPNGFEVMHKEFFKISQLLRTRIGELLENPAQNREFWIYIRTANSRAQQMVISSIAAELCLHVSKRELPDGKVFRLHS